MIQECRAKYYFLGLARKIRAWVTSCPDCIANKIIDTRQIRPKMLSNTDSLTYYGTRRLFGGGHTTDSAFIK